MGFIMDTHDNIAVVDKCFYIYIVNIGNIWTNVGE